MFTEYEPGGYAAFVSPTPLMMVVALGDVLTVADLALEAYERALQPKRLVTMTGGHFDAYVNFKASARPATEWFTQHLLAKQRTHIDPARDEALEPRASILGQNGTSRFLGPTRTL
jgi:hypothetical protein